MLRSVIIRAGLRNYFQITSVLAFSSDSVGNKKVFKMMPSYTANYGHLEQNKFPVIDLRSDTVSKPSKEMRQAMFDAVVGDDVYEDDPTVKELEQMAAKMMNKEAGLFVASGTMGNLISIMAHCDKRGSEIICGSDSHTFLYEQGGPAQIAGVSTCTVPNKPDGTYDLKQVEAHIHGLEDVHRAKTSLIIVENTHNMCGGKVLPLSWLQEVGALGKKYKIPLHMDGARVFNAAVYLKVPVAEVVKHFDSIQFCLSKSLGCPVGSLIVGTREFISKGRRLRKVLGGGMRQIGVIAAPGIVALDKMVDRLADDHRRTREIAQGIADLESELIKVNLADLHTNILMIYLKDTVLTAPELCSRLGTVTDTEKATLSDDTTIVRVSPKSNSVVRLVVYYEITDEDVSKIIKKIQYVIKHWNN